jgi:hypothetical protein
MSDHRLRFCIGASLLLALVCGNAALAGGPLFPGAQYAVGDSPASVAVGDLNGDEPLDLADNLGAHLGIEPCGSIVQRGETWAAKRRRAIRAIEAGEHV